MTREQAERLNIGDTITYRGTERTILSKKIRGIAAPYFRFNGDDGSLTSYTLCGLPEAESTPPCPAERIGLDFWRASDNEW